MKTNWGDRLDVRYYLMKRLSSMQGKKVLDVACGNGYLLKALPESNEKYGIDSSGESVSNARKESPDSKVLKASMYRLPFKNDFFDTVVMANVMPNADFKAHDEKREHNQKKAVAEAWRVLKKKGTLFLTTPNNAFYKTVKVEYQELDSLLKPFFDYKIRGWNPFPKFPYFLPARVLKHFPGWFSLLEWMTEKNLFAKKSKFFFVEAVKK